VCNNNVLMKYNNDNDNINGNNNNDNNEMKIILMKWLILIM